VLASQTSSLPEVVGDAGALVDPTSVPDLARAIDGLLAAPGVRRAMAARGLERAAEFSWDRCARATRTALERAAMGSV
jgi:alpha-1,3-rhamnosyl/mannosyltransferase